MFVRLPCPEPGPWLPRVPRVPFVARFALMGRRDLLSDAAVPDAIAGLHWEREGSHLVRRLELASFRDAIAFVAQVADVAEAMDHHPEIDIRWRTVALRVTTDSAAGLTMMDVEFARRVDALLPEGH